MCLCVLLHEDKSSNKDLCHLFMTNKLHPEQLVLSNQPILELQSCAVDCCAMLLCTHLVLIFPGGKMYKDHQC
jgi:hypothetical protein